MKLLLHIQKSVFFEIYIESVSSALERKKAKKSEPDCVVRKKNWVWWSSRVDGWGFFCPFSYFLASNTIWRSGNENNVKGWKSDGIRARRKWGGGRCRSGRTLYSKMVIGPEYSIERDEREPSLPFNVLEVWQKALYNLLLCGGSAHSYRHMTTNTPHRHMGWRKF